jgi:hypothetical protein
VIFQVDIRVAHVLFLLANRRSHYRKAVADRRDAQQPLLAISLLQRRNLSVNVFLPCLDLSFQFLDEVRTLRRPIVSLPGIAGDAMPRNAARVSMPAVPIAMQEV